MDFKGIIRENHPELDIASFRRDTEGWSFDTFEVNGEYIFRFAGSERSKANMRREIALLPTLAKHLGFRIPDFRFINLRLPYVGYRKIEGTLLDKCDLSSDALARHTAECILQIHSFPRETALGLGVRSKDWLIDYKELFGRIKAECYGHLDGDVCDSASEYIEGFLGNRENFGFTPRFIHRDLSAETHILCSGDRVTGIIDWEDACIGDPAIDFTGILWDCGEDFAERVIGHYEDLGGTVDRTFRDRTMFYRRIGHFYTIMYGLEINSKEFFTMGVRKITEEFGSS